MILQFCDRDDINAHKHFQQWRRQNPKGFFINCKSASIWMLHRSMCRHPGGTDFLAENWGSLTRRRKICSVERRELVKFVEKAGLDLQRCSDCKSFLWFHRANLLFFLLFVVLRIT